MALEYNTTQYVQISIILEVVDTKEKTICGSFIVDVCELNTPWPPPPLPLRHYFNLPRNVTWRVKYASERYVSF